MKIINQSTLKGRGITKFDSKNSFTYPFLKEISDCQITFMEIKPNGILGLHQADIDQLFIVLKGDGFISDQYDQHVRITKGDCIFWQKDEWHKTISTGGLRALIIESKELFSKI